ncbi:AGZA family xanthine/uracil permease-like MFS transporter [Mycolicibacterium mucogenicum 261Sha1.1M5]|uniref:AGZA family xanthine/uracil permease-like MFS transporter n=1 Tax=Leucobacter aridicollis TaxID=283878 RepID=A0A852R971_9MICO|nr:NCS2 family permease [Leucobacter aridicollis]MBL3681567.1 NCS2 family permease [Leucobacter aridicollis]NYD27398.1 AGZA family xanthine/uracil permease-like MFS transporter [Leucobacter aridicollis]RKQ94957.1 AGZA family xanthine/uracil permease-like MFS transporter [Mycolicibacterium mucogenicum 261Sha1.1M5]
MSDATQQQVKERGFLDRYFEITKRGSTIGTEVRGGLVTFVTMAYIVILNPIILSGKEDIAGNILDFGQVSAATALAAGVMTILFGIVSRLPFAFAAGLGINAFLAFSVVQEVTWPEAMAIVIINGLLIVLLAATGLRRMIFDAVPVQLKLAITVGIGFFIAFIGFVNSGFVDSTGQSSPPVGLGPSGVGFIATIPTVIFVVTLVLTGILVAKKVKGGILIGLVSGTLIAVIVEAIWKIGPKFADDGSLNPGGWSLTEPVLQGNPFAIPDLGLVGAVSFDFGKVGVVTVIMLVFTLLFTNFFDAMGTMTGLSREAQLADEKGNFPRIKSALVVEGVGAVVGGGTSSSSTTVFIESGAGIGEGARTGLANIVTGVVFLLAMFFTPLTQIVPTEVAAAALVIVGAMMMSQISNIDLGDFRVLLPVFLTAAVMPLSYSIANGIGAGFISWVLIHAFTGRAKQVHWLLWIVSLGFVIFFARGPIEALLGV